MCFYVYIDRSICSPAAVTVSSSIQNLFARYCLNRIQLVNIFYLFFRKYIKKIFLPNVQTPDTRDNIRDMKPQEKKLEPKLEHKNNILFAGVALEKGTSFVNLRCHLLKAVQKWIFHIAPPSAFYYQQESYPEFA